jgi:hypothetical protein
MQVMRDVVLSGGLKPAAGLVGIKVGWCLHNDAKADI